MAATFRWIALFAVALVLTALLQPHLERFLEGVGWSTAPGQAVTMALNWIEQLVGVEAFPWLGGIVIGLAAGSWIDGLLRRLDGRHPIGRVARGKVLAVEAAYMGARIEQYLANPFAHRASGPTLWVESLIILDKLEKIGIPMPIGIQGPFDNDMAKRLCLAFQLLAPLLREGDLSAARGLIRALNEGSEREAQTSSA